MACKFAILIAALILTHAPAAEGMEFTVQYDGGNCGSCVWVQGHGVIDQGTTEKFKAFVAKEKPPKILRLNSPGGNLIEALIFGRFLRKSNWDTLAGDYLAAISKSSCYSACVYVFAGGVHRFAQGNSLGIHQFYRPDEAMRPNDKTLSAVDMANTQQLAALLNEYVRQMGVDPRLVTIASNITPWETIYVLSRAEAESLNLDNSSAPANPTSSNWNVQPIGNGAIAITTQTQDGAGRIASLGIMCVRSQPEHDYRAACSAR